MEKVGCSVEIDSFRSTHSDIAGDMHKSDLDGSGRVLLFQFGSRACYALGLSVRQVDTLNIMQFGHHQQHKHTCKTVWP